MMGLKMNNSKNFMHCLTCSKFSLNDAWSAINVDVADG